MMRALFAGVSGLRAHQIRMDVIGNNIANVNTAGYKKSRVTFQDLIYQTMRGGSAPTADTGGIDPMQVGLGAAIASITTSYNPGNLQTTDVPTDLAIEGNGFFVLRSGSEQYYTRAGTFKIDRDGNLVSRTNGLYVLGWTADPTTGLINTSTPIGTINIPAEKTIDPIVTTQITFGGNLDARANGTLSYGDLVADDGAGNTSGISIDLVPTGNFNEWAVTVTAANGTFASNGSNTLTGTITLDAAGNVVAVTGFNGGTDTLNINGGGPVTFLAPTVGAGPGTFTVNNPAPAVPDSTTGAFTPAPTKTTSIRVFDSLGNDHTIVFDFQKTGNNTWSWTASASGLTMTGNSGTLGFDTAGQLTSLTGGPLAITVPGAGAMNVALDFMSLSQFADDMTAVAERQDGYPAGSLTGIAIGPDGTVVGTFSNGLTQNLARIAVATFANPAGLNREGDTMFSVSSNSGDPIIGSAGIGSLGDVTAGTLEMSNVDLAEEFTDMIVTQRGFEANSRIITTSDEMLETLVNLKR